MELSDAELRDLYDRYARVLFVRCRSILRNDEAAQDAVQETFARVILKSDTFREQSSKLTWMYTIATNYCLNQLRNQRGRGQKLADHKHDIAGPQATAPEEDGTDRARVLALLADADAETRAVVVHTYFDDCTRQETARLVGISVPTVRKRLRTFVERARRRLDVVGVVLALCSFAHVMGSL